MQSVQKKQGVSLALTHGCSQKNPCNIIISVYLASLEVFCLGTAQHFRLREGKLGILLGSVSNLLLVSCLVLRKKKPPPPRSRTVERAL